METLKQIFSKNFILPFKKDVRFIFIYHDISNKSSIQHSNNYSTTVNTFKEQIEFLSHYFNWVNLNEIHNPKPFKYNVATIVFDDGFKSVTQNAQPYLNSLNIPFSVFINKSAVIYNRIWVSDLIFNINQFDDYLTHEAKLSRDFIQLETDIQFMNNLNSTQLNKYANEQIYLNEYDILNLHKQGVIIGNHGSMHANLALCNERSLKSEIIDNKTFIENIINSKVNHYAIAFGKNQHYSHDAVNVIKKSGHQFIYSSNPVQLSLKHKHELIPRIGLTENSNDEIMFYINRQFLKKVNL